MLFLYFILFYILGIILWITRKYDFITIGVVYTISATFLWFGGFESFLYLLFFFGIAEGLTLILNKKHEKRSYRNLLGNCLASSLFLIFGLKIAAITGICAAFCDTLSSEIGRLSKRKQHLMITNFKKVDKGVDGAISFIGTSAGFVIGLLTFIYFYYIFHYSLKLSLIIFLVGFAGTLIDSLYGGLFETKGYIDNNQTNFLATFTSSLIALILLYVL